MHCVSSCWVPCSVCIELHADGPVLSFPTAYPVTRYGVHTAAPLWLTASIRSCQKLAQSQHGTFQLGLDSVKERATEEARQAQNRLCDIYRCTLCTARMLLEVAHGFLVVELLLPRDPVLYPIAAAGAPAQILLGRPCRCTVVTH